MSKFNKKQETPTIVNKQGGTGYALKPELELVSVLATGLDTGTFYEKTSDREQRLIDLIKKVGSTNPEFVAKALVYARTVMGQRSVTHVGAVALAPMLSGTKLGSRFFSKRSRKENEGGIVFRLDDMLEIMAYYFLRNTKKSIPNSIKKGFKSALEKADSYELAKYQGKGKQVSLVDLVNLFRPKPSSEMQETFKKLMIGELKQFNTSEDKMSDSGQKVSKLVKSGKVTKEEGEKILSEEKAENWKELISSRKIGYFALLRNLRNIVNNSEDKVFEQALTLLTDRKLVKSSLVFPHQIDIAFEVLMLDGNIPQTRKVKLLTAVNEAYELAIPNLTELFNYGKTAVVIDTSGSMHSGPNSIYGKGILVGKDKRINSAPIEKAALIGATLAKGIGADLFQFASYCKQVNFNPLDSINTIKKTCLSKEGEVGHGTAFGEIFKTLMSGKYTRIFIISDLQGGDSIVGKNSSYYSQYVSKNGKPTIYSIDLVGYGSTMFKQNDKLIQLYGYSSDIYEMVKKAELDPQAIIKEINKINI